jgi:hypothetical protein
MGTAAATFEEQAQEPAFAFMQTPAVAKAIGLAGEALIDAHEQTALVGEAFKRLSDYPTTDRAEAYLHELDRQLRRLTGIRVVLACPPCWTCLIPHSPICRTVPVPVPPSL